MILLRAVGHIIGVQVRIHVLVIPRRVLARMGRSMRLRRLPPSRPRAWSMAKASLVGVGRSSRRRTSGHVNWRGHPSGSRQSVYSSWARRYVLPSRQMAASHLASLGMCGRLREPLAWMRHPVDRLGRCLLSVGV